MPIHLYLSAVYVCVYLLFHYFYIYKIYGNMEMACCVFKFDFLCSPLFLFLSRFLFCDSISRILLGRFTALINWAIKISPQRFLFSFDASKQPRPGHWVSRHLERQSTNDGIIIQPNTIQYSHTTKRTYSSSDNKFVMYSLSIQNVFLIAVTWRPIHFGFAYASIVKPTT